jgi:hypothetical protein
MSEYVEATRGKDLTLLGQIGLYHPVEETRATALNYWREGFEGIYLFNWYAPLGQDDLWRESLVEIGDPELLRHRNKRYVVDVQVGGLWKRSHPKGQLPLRIEEARSGRGPQVSFQIGDDIQAASAQGKQASAQLVMRFEEVREDDDLQLKLNGVLLAQEAGEMKFKPTLFWKEFWFHLPIDPRILKVGLNQLELVLNKRNPRLEAPLILSEMNVVIEYKTRT